MVESGGEALCIIAAYLDLNPVRVGLVDDPQATAAAGMTKVVIARSI